MRAMDEVPHVVVGIRTMRPFGFNQFRTAVLRSTEHTVDATVEVVAYPDRCDLAVVEQGAVYDTAPDARVVRVSHQDVRDFYQLSMRVRRELQSYLADRG